MLGIPPSPSPKAPGAPFGHSATALAKPFGGFVTVARSTAMECADVAAVAEVEAHPTPRQPQKQPSDSQRSCFIVPLRYMLLMRGGSPKLQAVESAVDISVRFITAAGDSTRLRPKYFARYNA